MQDRKSCRKPKTNKKSLSVITREQRRLEGEQKRKELKDLARERQRIESEGLIHKVIANFYLFREGCKRLDPDLFFDRHHPIPRSVTRIIRKKIEHKELPPEQIRILMTIDCELTKRVCKPYHQNFNSLLKGNCHLVDVIRKLNEVILNPRHQVTSMNNKRHILEFMFFVAHHTGKHMDLDRISSAMGKQNYIVPVRLLEPFGINREDIMKYLADNFFYPDYESYGELWAILKRNGNKKAPQSAELLGEEALLPIS